jgi:hypothetical protein
MDYRVLKFGVGLTDLAKRIAASSDHGIRSHYDVEAFVAEIRTLGPDWVTFHGKEAAKAVSRVLGSGGEVSLGEQIWSVADSRVFVLPTAWSNRDASRLEGEDGPS